MSSSEITMHTRHSGSVENSTNCRRLLAERFIGVDGTKLAAHLELQLEIPDRWWFAERSTWGSSPTLSLGRSLLQAVSAQRVRAVSTFRSDGCSRALPCQ